MIGLILGLPPAVLDERSLSGGLCLTLGLASAATVNVVAGALLASRLVHIDAGRFRWWSLWAGTHGFPAAECEGALDGTHGRTGVTR